MKKEKKILTENEALEFDKEILKTKEVIERMKKLLKEKGYDKSK
jgi:hypothetical protein